MKVAAFLLSVTVFTTLFLESSTTPVDVAAKIIGDVKAVVAAIAGNVAKNVDADEQANAIVAVPVVPFDRLVASVKAVTGEIKEALKEAFTEIESTLRRKVLVEAVQEMVTKAFDISNAALDDAIKTGEETLAKAIRGDKERVTQVLNWLKPFVNLSAIAENTIDDALVKDTVEALENAIALLNSAIVEVETGLPKYINILKESPSKLMHSYKTVVKKDIDIILSYATADLQALKSLQSKVATRLLKMCDMCDVYY